MSKFLSAVEHNADLMVGSEGNLESNDYFTFRHQIQMASDATLSEDSS